jgi:hypothetical protein
MNLCAGDIPVQADRGYRGPERPDSDSFESAIAEIEGAVVESCAAHSEWPARIAAGINGAIEFAISNPAVARKLAVDSRAVAPPEGSTYPEMIQRLSALLGAGAPRSERLPASSDESIVWVIAAIVSCHVRSGTVDSLAEGDPDLVFLALLPYVGFAEACRWSATL